MHEANITRVDGETWTGVGMAVNTTVQQLALAGSHKFPAGDYILSIAFGGNLTDSLHGFYRSSYKHNGETRWIAVGFSVVIARSCRFIGDAIRVNRCAQGFPVL